MGKLEVELKARIANPEDCGEKLTALAGGGTSFSKDDAYWSFPANADKTRGLPFSGLRVRREKKEIAEHTFVTWKRKKKRDAIEVNEEHEFEVSNADEFEELIILLGFEKQIVKHKEGRVWCYNGIAAELCEVSGFAAERAANGVPAKSGFTESVHPEPPKVKNLGWFLELEILSPDSGEVAVIAAREKLLSLLKKAGLHEEDLESRYYAELLTIP